ncbi:hypothetical protein FQA39_LY18605 [Lamprigera yunnana]|nr:hypothetical protein FQA39_LY18605 [Lamprigera yunnana]
MLVLYSVKKPRNYPPGPTWLPIVGCLPYVNKIAKKVQGGQHIILDEISKRWKTDVLGLKFGKQLVVAVSSYEAIRDVYANDAFNARPNNFFGKLRQIGNKPGITCAEDPVLSIQKKFILRQMHEIRLGESVLEGNIKRELKDVLSMINSTNAEVDVGEIFQCTLINLIWRVINGDRISRNDPKSSMLVDLLNKRIHSFDMAGGTLSNYPWLTFIAPNKVGYNIIKRMNQKMKTFLMGFVKEHHKTWTDGNNTDLMYSFISKMKETEGNGSFTDDQLLMVSVDMLVGGAHTAGGTLTYACLLMLLHQDVQEKVQKELDENCSNNHCFRFSDRQKLPYTQAVLLELIRMYHILPIAGSRRAIRETQISSYIIPKDTTILINMYPILMSEQIWGDPEVFRPERFLNEAGKIKRMSKFVPFGFGRRRCLGESLARMSLFIIFAELLKRYKILPIENKPLPSATPIRGIVCMPQPYLARFQPRYN